MLYHSKVGVLNCHANNNKPSVFKGCRVWHEINLGSVTARQQMAHSVGLFKLSWLQRIFTKVCARYRKATRIRQYPNTSKTISNLQGGVESGSYRTPEGQSLMERDTREDRRLVVERRNLREYIPCCHSPPSLHLPTRVLTHRARRYQPPGPQTR